MVRARPLVGLLFNPTTPLLLPHTGALVEYLAVMPERLWNDFGNGEERRFVRDRPLIDDVRRAAEGRTLAGHGIDLSLPSAVPLDAELLDAIAALAAELDFRWYSEHLSAFIAPRGRVPNAQAGLGLPVVYDEETYAIVGGKLAQMRAALGVPLLLENGSIFTPIPELEMSEPQFLNRLHAEGRGGTLLDLHNLYVTARACGLCAEAYLDALGPDGVGEIHLGGGNAFDGFYLDSHSDLTPPAVWRLAHDYAPRCRNLRAITFEYHESYFERLGVAALTGELERMHALAQACVHAG